MKPRKSKRVVVTSKQENGHKHRLGGETVTVESALKAIKKRVGVVASETPVKKGMTLEEVSDVLAEQEGLLHKLELKERGVYAGLAIEQGKVLLELKRHFRGALSKMDINSRDKFKWTTFLKRHFPGVSDRTCQNRMALARREDAPALLVIGYKALVQYCSATKEIYGRGRIDTFLKKRELDPKNVAKLSPAEFSRKVKESLPAARLKGAAPKLTYQDIETFLFEKNKVSKELLEELTKAKDPSKVLARWASRAGKEEAEQKKPIKDFLKSAENLRAAVEVVKQHEVDLGKQDRKVVRKLVSDLRSLAKDR